MKKGLKVVSNPTSCKKCPIKERALYQAFSDTYINDAEQKRTEQFSIPARTPLYDEHDSSHHAYTLFEGWLLLYRAHSDGSRQGLRIALSGDFIGYTPILELPRNHSALALTPCVLCGFEQQDLHVMMKDHPSLAMQVTQFQSRDMARCQTSILGIGRKTAEGRISHLLLELFERLRNRGIISGQSRTMPFPLTQEVIADMTGLTQVHVNRIMNKLKTDKLIECGSKKITILQWERLAEVGEYSLPPNFKL
ncbi:MAG: Crp/Fnr family transcriptional regulator [bacterium]